LEVSWTQTFSVNGTVVSPLRLVVDPHGNTFLLACVGACEAGDRLFAKLDRRGKVRFSKRLSARHEVQQFDLLSLSKNGERVGVAGNQVDADSSTEFAAEVFDDDGHVLARSHDEAPATAADANFSKKGHIIVVGRTSESSGLAVSFDPSDRHGIEWRFSAPDARFTRIRSDRTGSSSIAGTTVADPIHNVAAVWRLSGQGALEWSFTAPPEPSRPPALAVDNRGNTALVSTRPGPEADGASPVRFITTKLDAGGSVLWTVDEGVGANSSTPIEAMFGRQGELTVFGSLGSGGRPSQEFHTTRYNEAGVRLWSNSDDFGFFTANPTAMDLDQHGGVAEVGVAGSLDRRTGIVVVYDADGNLRATQRDPARLVDVGTDRDGGVIVLGALDDNTVVTRYVFPAVCNQP
jgi:hypothetical protein